MNAPKSSIFDMSLRKSERKRKAVTIWEEKDASPAAKDPKIAGKKRPNGAENRAQSYRNWASS
jgi:hypothetical protein